MKIFVLLLACVLPFIPGPVSAAGPAIARLPTQWATFAIDASGSWCGLSRNPDGRDYLAPDQPAPVLSLRVGGKWFQPEHAEWESVAHRLKLHYHSNEWTATITTRLHVTHLSLELVSLQPTNGVDLVLWGPYPTRIGEMIGETIGVVQDREFAIGIQSLNPRTLGGYPTEESDIEAGFSGDDRGAYPNLPAELAKGQEYRGDTARTTPFGSVLQAYCRNRFQDRVIANWGHERYLAKAYADGGVVGSRIALFGCPAAKARDTIGAIEVAEGLPHPLLDGVWAKVAPGARTAYLIVDFSEANVERAIEMTRHAGLKYLYHSSPFETWGHFVLKKSLFPNGWDGLRACAEKARQAGVRIGFHTLSNFITPNDAYVTPKPDPRLARIGESALTDSVDAEQKEIRVAAPEFFQKHTVMNTVVIDQELIKYSSVSTNAPWRLIDCQRGAWGTTASAHAAGAAVGKLLDHDYKVFLTDADLSQEVARRIAELCNVTGAAQLSFDGLEGNWSTGMGQYGRTLFTQAWYDALTPQLRGQVINDASNPGHFNWHIYTRMNWGEPWYAGFRESQTLYRFKNQLYFERNLMPHMLGWFALRPETSVADAEWLLARAAGFDAGFALAASLASTAQLAADPASAEASRNFGAVPAILEAIRQWETARMSGAFPPVLQAQLRDNTREFHLSALKPGSWELSEIHVRRFTHDAAGAASTETQFQNEDAAQVLGWTLTATGKQPLAGLNVTLNGQSLATLKEKELPSGGHLQYVGGSEAQIFDNAWREIGRVPVAGGSALVKSGKFRFGISCPAQAGTGVKIEVTTRGAPVRIGQG